MYVVTRSPMQTLQRIVSPVTIADMYAEGGECVGPLTTLLAEDYIDHAYSDLVRAGFVMLPSPLENPTDDLDHLRQVIHEHHAIPVSLQHNETTYWSAEANMKHRLVHDWWHYNIGADFDPDGEIRASTAELRLLYGRHTLEQVIFSDSIAQVIHYLVKGYFINPQHFVRYPIDLIRKISSTIF